MYISSNGPKMPWLRSQNVGCYNSFHESVRLHLWDALKSLAVSNMNTSTFRLSEKTIQKPRNHCNDWRRKRHVRDQKKDQTRWSSVELTLQPSYSLPCFWCKCFSFLLSRWRSISSSLSLLRRMLWCLRIWFHCCLLIYLFLSLLIATCNSSVVISRISFISFVSVPWSSMLFSVSIFVVFQLNIVILLVVVELAVELSKDVGNPFLWCVDFALFIFHLRDEYSSSWRFYAGNVPVSIEIFEYYLNLFLSFHSFLVSDAFS